MKPTIKELWFEYQQDKDSELSEEKKDIHNKLCELSEELIATLDEKQKEKFDSYCDTFTELYSLEEYEAFEKGVSFTVRFLTEAAR